MMRSRVTFLTPTYERDLKRFTLLRESMERCDIDIPHIAVVQDEHLAQFKAIPFQRGLTLLSTREALPPDIERRRTARGYPRKNPMHWISPKPIVGWASQQIVKLCAPSYIDCEGILCLDSDVFFVDRVDEADFFTTDGRLHLYEKDREFTVETITWMAQSMRALQVPLGQDPYLYVHNPVPLSRTVLQSMQARLEEIHGKSWIEVFLENNLTEYTTYGVYARYVNGLKGLEPVRPPYTLNYWHEGQLQGYTDSLVTRVEAERARIVCISAAIGRDVTEYRPLIERLWSMRLKGSA